MGLLHNAAAPIFMSITISLLPQPTGPVSGVKHAFAGADPELSFRYEGNDGRAYTLRNSQDKTHFILSLSGETEFAKGWFLNGEAQLQKGAHDKDISAYLQFKRVW